MMMRRKWLMVRAAAVSYDGLISTASLMMGFGAVQEDAKAMILAGIAGLVAGACSTAIREFVSMLSEPERDQVFDPEEAMPMENKWPINRLLVAAASGVAFVLGAAVPLVAAASTVKYCQHLRLVVVAVAASLGLLGFGGLGGFLLGRHAHMSQSQYLMVMKSSIRVLVGGWMAIVITFIATKYSMPSSYTCTQLSN